MIKKHRSILSIFLTSVVVSFDGIEQVLFACNSSSKRVRRVIMIRQTRTNSSARLT